jgi:hypothetical protein
MITTAMTNVCQMYVCGNLALTGLTYLEIR